VVHLCSGSMIYTTHSCTWVSY